MQINVFLITFHCQVEMPFKRSSRRGLVFRPYVTKCDVPGFENLTVHEYEGKLFLLRFNIA